MTNSLITRIVLGATVLSGALWLARVPDPLRQHYPSRVKVVFWHMWGAEWQPIVEDACKRFNDYQTQYEVVPLSIPSGDAGTKFLLSAAGGDAPDLVSQWMPIKGSWADKGFITPLEDVMTPKEKEDFLRDAFPIMKKHAMVRGHLVCGVITIDVGGLFIRTDQLKEAGYTVADVPRDLESFMAFARKLDRKDKDGTLKRVGFLPMGADNYVALFGGNFGTEDAPTLTTPQNKAAFQFMSQELGKVGFDKVKRFLSSQAADQGATAPLIAGNYTMMLDGQWRVKQVLDFAPKLQYAVLPMPGPKGAPPMASMTGANYLLIPKAAHSKQGAWAFMKFWMGITDPEIGGKNISDMGWLPYSQKVVNSKTYQAYLKKVPQYKTFVDILASPNLKTPAEGPLQAYVGDQLASLDSKIGQGKNPDESLKQAEDAIQAELLRQRRLGHVR